MDRYYIFASSWHILTVAIRGAIISIVVAAIVGIVGDGNPLILYGMSFFLCLSWILLMDLLLYREPDIIEVAPPPKPADLAQAVILSRITTPRRRYEELIDIPDQSQWGEWNSVASSDRLPGIIAAIFETGKASSRSTRATRGELRNLHRFLLSRGYAIPYQKGIRLTDAGRAEIDRIHETHSPIPKIYPKMWNPSAQNRPDADTQTKKEVYKLFR